MKVISIVRDVAIGLLSIYSLIYSVWAIQMVRGRPLYKVEWCVLILLAGITITVPVRATAVIKSGLKARGALSQEEKAIVKAIRESMLTIFLLPLLNLLYVLTRIVL